MFDLFFAALGSAIPGSPPGRQEATTWEEIVWATAATVFPFVDFLLMLSAGDDSSTVMLVMLPVGFALITTVLSALGGSIFLRTLVAALTCLLFCLAAGFAAALLGVFTAF